MTDLQSIVIDNGSYCIKAGISGLNEPTSRTPSVITEPNDITRLKRPIQSGITTNYEA